MENATGPRFVADAMLGKLARWLRILGYDTLYVQADDAAIANIARAQHRILLTRDTELARRRGLHALLIESQALPDQLSQVVTYVGGASNEQKPRCMECNTILIPMSRQEARNYVPTYVAQTHEVFQHCPHCRRTYWEGTHWEDIQHRLEGLNGENVH